MDRQDQFLKAQGFLAKHSSNMRNAMNIFIIIMLFVIMFSGNVTGVNTWFALIFTVLVALVNGALPFVENFKME